MNQRKPDSLRDQLNAFYGEVELSPEKTDELIERSHHLPNRGRRMVIGLVGMAAAIALVGVSIYTLGNRGGAAQVAKLALAEVAKNHLKDVEPEVLSSDYAVVQEHLARLDFRVAPPADGLVAGYDLVGGRYCKVQGEFAAQLKLRPEGGEPTATAYVVPADGKLAPLKEAGAVIDGVRVRCRRTGEILVFLAESERAGEDRGGE